MSKRPKPTIKNRTHSEDKLKFMEQKLSQATLSQYQKRGYLRRFLAGHWPICHEVPTR
jgi:hypothetical protein